MEVTATVYDRDIHGNTVTEEVHITYFSMNGQILIINYGNKK